jgi:acyl-CoA synthetase (AMP-forming)/AMP-acid ligase II
MKAKEIAINPRKPFPIERETLVDLLRWRAVEKSQKVAYTFLLDGETEASHLTYTQLDLKARMIAFWLQEQGLSGQRALLLYPPGLEFICGFFGCLYAGVIAIPAYPPKPNRSMVRLEAILKDSQPAVILTKRSLLAKIEHQLIYKPKLMDLCWLATDNFTDDLASNWQAPDIAGDSLAFLQYTSGSTGKPKGVMVSHKNLLRNSADLDQGWDQHDDSIIVTWLPTFHDMGLIYGAIQPLYKGIPCYMMSPIHFLQRPWRWLQAISRYKGTHSGAPNFAYDLCVRKISLEQRQTLDLSSWRMALNGAEPVKAEVLYRFAEAFEPCGFNLKAFCPGYGLAEATLKVTATRTKDLPTFCKVKTEALGQNRVVEVTDDSQEGQILVGCGQTEIDTKILIVNPETCTPCLPDQIGEIWVSGSTVAQGYWQRQQETEETFHAYLADTNQGPFLRTGDLGFWKNGHLFVTGRLKDVIIIRGSNYYPQDIELKVQQSHPALRPDAGAAFGIEVKGEEKLVIVQEVERTYLRRLDLDAIAKAIYQGIKDQYELQVQAIALIKTGSIAKTSSGKIQRSQCRKQFLNQTLDLVGLVGGEKTNGPFSK